MVRRRQDRKCADLFARCLPARGAQTLCAVGKGARRASRALPARRELDRRRPRRQSLRHRRNAATSDGTQRRGGTRPLYRSDPCARRRDRKSVVTGKSVSERVVSGCRSLIKKKNKEQI